MDMLETALYIGIDEDKFFQMTITEVARSVKAWGKRKANEDKEKAVNNYILANLIAENVACLMSSDAKVRGFEEVYRHLFNSKELEELNKQKELQESKVLSAKFQMFAENMNLHRKER